MQLQEREYKEALEAFNDKHKEKVQLISRLMEVSTNLLMFSFSNDVILERFSVSDLCNSIVCISWLVKARK